MQQKTAFVTGGTGFLGLNLIELLCKEGWKVYALHRSDSDLTFLKRFEVILCEGALDKPESLSLAMPEAPDAVFHLAANTSLWKKKNAEQYRDNVEGTRYMAATALEKKAGRFIHVSSISAFGMQKTLIDEKSPLLGSSSKIHYDQSKHLGEEEIRKAVEKGLDAVILSPTHIMGKYDKGNWSQLILHTYHNSLPGIPPGTGMYAPVGEVARALLTAVEKGKKGEKYLLGGEKANFLQVINLIETILDKPLSKKSTPAFALRLLVWAGHLGSFFSSKEPRITPEKYYILTKTSICDFSKAQRELGYRSLPLEQMLRECYEWLKVEGLLDRFKP